MKKVHLMLAMLGLLITAVLSVLSVQASFNTSTAVDVFVMDKENEKTTDTYIITESIDATAFKIDYENAKAVGYLDVIDKYIRKNPNSDLSKYYITAWITKDNVATILLSDKNIEIQRFIREDLKCADVDFEFGEGNWKENEEQQYRLNTSLIRFSEEVRRIQEAEKKGADLNGAEQKAIELFAYYPTVTSDCYTGKTIIRLALADRTAEYVQQMLPSGGGNDAWINTLPEEIATDHSFVEFTDGIKLFKEIIGTEEDIYYKAVSISEGGPIDAKSAEYSSWSPSRGIQASTSSTNSNPSLNAEAGSTGFQCWYSTFDNSGNEITHVGFVTAGHIAIIDETALNNQSNWRTNVFSQGTTSKIGSVMQCWYGGYLDAAFFELTNSISVSTILYYSNQNSPVNVSWSYINPYDGQKIYKSGVTTGVTEGNVYNAAYSYWVTPSMYFCGLIQADCGMAQGGDSGGIAYTLVIDPSTGGITAKPVGIVRGPDPVWTLFTSAKWIHQLTNIN